MGNSILAVPGLANTTLGFRAKLWTICARHVWDADAIAAVMCVETGRTYSPRAGESLWSPKRTATGLIQFIEATAKGLGVTPVAQAPSAALAAKGEGKAWATWALMYMTAEMQLDLVERYYSRAFAARAPSRPVDYYLVTWGTYPGRADGDVLAVAGDKLYEANTGLDRNKDGKITVGDLRSLIDGVMNAAKGERLPADAPSSLEPLNAGASGGVEMIAFGLALAPMLVRILKGGRL